MGETTLKKFRHAHRSQSPTMIGRGRRPQNVSALPETDTHTIYFYASTRADTRAGTRVGTRAGFWSLIKGDMEEMLHLLSSIFPMPDAGSGRGRSDRVAPST